MMGPDDKDGCHTGQPQEVRSADVWLTLSQNKDGSNRCAEHHSDDRVGNELGRPVGCKYLAHRPDERDGGVDQPNPQCRDQPGIELSLGHGSHRTGAARADGSTAIRLDGTYS